MLKEYRLIVPTDAPVAEPVQHAVMENIERRACEAFGGFTRADAHGGWVDSNGRVVTEPVAVYTFAIDCTRLMNGEHRLDGAELIAFESMVQLVRVALKQAEVYRVTPDGPIIN